MRSPIVSGLAEAGFLIRYFWGCDALVAVSADLAQGARVPRVSSGVPPLIILTFSARRRERHAGRLRSSDHSGFVRDKDVAARVSVPVARSRGQR
jgi:hypothetical protein